MSTFALIQAIKALDSKAIAREFASSTPHPVIKLLHSVDAYRLTTPLTEANVVDLQRPIRHTERDGMYVYRPAYETVLFAHFRQLSQMHREPQAKVAQRAGEIEQAIVTLSQHTKALSGIDGNDCTLLHHAAIHFTKLDAINALLKAGVDPLQQSFMVERTALDEAVEHGHEAIAKRLKQVSGVMVRLHHLKAGSPLLRNTERGAQ